MIYRAIAPQLARENKVRSHFFHLLISQPASYGGSRSDPASNLLPLFALSNLLKARKAQLEFRVVSLTSTVVEDSRLHTHHEVNEH